MPSDPSTWAELKASLANWLNRDDLSATEIPEAIALAERRFQRTIFSPEREVMADLAVDAEAVALPADLWGVKALHLATDPNSDLAARTSATNAGFGNQFALDQAGRTDAASQFGALQNNQAALARAGLQADAARFGAAATNSANLANQGVRAQYGLAQAGLDENAARYGADSTMQANLANQQWGNQLALSQAGLTADAARFGAEANNARALAQAGLQANAGQFNSDLAARTSALNAGFTNDLASLQAQLQQQAALANQAAQGDMSRFNAQLGSQNAQFNAGQRDAASARALQAAQLLQSGANDHGAGTRADLQTLAALGDQQRQIEQAYATAPLAQLQAMGQLSGMTPYDILVGRQMQGSSTGTTQGTGTQVTKSTPSLFQSFLDLGNMLNGFKAPNLRG